jgi:hypothetical protein
VKRIKLTQPNGSPLHLVADNVPEFFANDGSYVRAAKSIVSMVNGHGAPRDRKDCRKARQFRRRTADRRRDVGCYGLNEYSSRSRGAIGVSTCAKTSMCGNHSQVSGKPALRT